MKMLKIGMATLMFAVATSAVADEEAFNTAAYDEANGAIGYTPISVNVIAPVALPWGRGKWDVFGVAGGLGYIDVCKLYGIAAAPGIRTRDEVHGIMFALGCNWSSADVYGIRFTFGLNVCNGEGHGIEFGGISYRRSFTGVDCNILGAVQENFKGVQGSGLVNITKGMTHGVTVATIANCARIAKGFQGSILFNMTEELNGCQIGLFNIAQECPWGFQIGLVNIIMDNTVPALPIFNGYFK